MVDRVDCILVVSLPPEPRGAGVGAEATCCCGSEADLTGAAPMCGGLEAALLAAAAACCLLASCGEGGNCCLGFCV